ncbi:MAG TPA: type VI secretion system protein TssA [Burkholderiales bacterium]|jgi:type VI secretion system protein ImpA|nr:type VI secretion system protein TssA [Burkholderiales bacterium]
MALDLDALLVPIAGDNPAGADISYDAVYDKIKEARRQDDANLAQGDWQAELKVAQWPLVRDLAQEVLSSQSKDLQIAAWLTEAMVQLKGFEGLADGLTLLERVLADYWDSCYPPADGEDLDQRAGKIAWLEKTLPMIVQAIPLTQSGSYGWFRWKESREVDNLGRTDPALREEAIANGKIALDTWDKAVINTPGEFYAPLLPVLAQCQAGIAALITRVDEKFGYDAPSLGQLRQAIADCADLLNRIARDKGLIGAEESAEEGTEEGGTAGAGGGKGGPLQTRAEALRRLGEVAEYFRRTEPHSPVAYLVDRAVRWGNMTLDQWLAEMIKDESMLGGLRETLGIMPPPAE